MKTSAVRSALSAPPPRDYAEPPGFPKPPRSDEPVEQPLRRLTRLEYVNTIRDLLGVEVDLPDGFSRDYWTEVGFTVGAPVHPPEGRQLLETALAVAAAAVPRLPELLPRCCTPEPAGAAEQEACAATFIATFGRRAFRRPLARSEGERLLALYRNQRDKASGFPDALATVIAAALQAPQFLYHRELGPFRPERDRNAVRLTSYELASRLSYLFWASMPDQALFDAAASNKLRNPSELAAQARRLLADPRSRVAIEDFHLQWMEVADLVEDAGPSTVSLELAQSMLAETREFVSQLFLAPAPPSLSALFTSPDSFADTRLAAHYGLAPVTGLQPVKLDPRQRAGLLTQASVLTGHGGADSAPTRRGVFVQGRLLCFEIPPPPPLVPPPPPGQTARQRFAAHSMDPQCAPCHNLIDPPGLTFENYDGLGRYRETEGGQPIDASARFALFNGTEVSVRNAIELAAVLARSNEGQECLVRQWLRYFLRGYEPQQRQGDVVQLLARAGGAQDVRAMLVTLTQTQLFQSRLLDQGEVLP